MTAAMRSLAVQLWHDAALRSARWRISGRTPRRDLSRLALVTPLAKSNGITQGACLQYDALRRDGYDVQMVDASPKHRVLPSHVDHSPATAYIMHVAGPETSHLLHSVLPESADAWRVGYWAWELPRPPREWAPFEALVHEVWTPSTFSARSLSGLFDVPVRVVPHRVPLEQKRIRDWNGPFTVLVMADSRSSFSRKNPFDAIEAFKQAFGSSTDYRLVLKLNGKPSEIAELAESYAGSANVKIVSERLSRDQLKVLYASVDVFLSLHRAEGFGLPMLEAMAHGVPVVGTGWSGNLDFMTEKNSVLVPYTLVPVSDSAGIYAHDAVWAAPDVDDAARALRALAADASEYERISDAAHLHVATQRHFGMQDVVDHV